MAFGAPGDTGDEKPFPQNRERVRRGAMRILCRAHSNGAKVTPCTPRGDQREQKNRVPRTSHC